MAAADRLGLSAAMTSKHVQHVEARVGARLLNRTSRRVSLTEAGADYLATIRNLLDGLEAAEARLADLHVEPRGTLKMSLPVWFSATGFTRLLANYRARHPNVHFDIDVSGRQVNLVEDAYDLALRVSPTLDEGLIAKRLMEISFYLVAAPSLLDRIGRPGKVDELNGMPLLAYTPVSTDGRMRLWRGPQTPEVRMTPVIQSANEALLFQAALEGMGVVIMPHPVAGAHLRSGALERLLPDQVGPEVTLSAIYPNRSFLPAKTRSFLDFLAGPEGLSSDPGFA